jgi:hypothetical protein
MASLKKMKYRRLEEFHFNQDAIKKSNQEDIVKWFSNLKIKSKVLISLFVAALITVIIGVVGYLSLSSSMEGTVLMYERQLVPIKDLGYLNAAILIQRGDIRTVSAVKTVEERQRQMASVDEQIKKADEIFAKFTEVL